jgi:hypothetical protein
MNIFVKAFFMAIVLLVLFVVFSNILLSDVS